MSDRIGNRSWWRHNRNLSYATNAERMTRSRHFDNACLDYLQWDAHHSACHWHDLVANRVGQNATHFRHELTNLPREEELAADRELVREICRATSDAQERVRVWHERTGHSPATFYRRKKEVDLGELD